MPAQAESPGSRSFPIGSSSGDDTEERMRGGFRNSGLRGMTRGISRFQLAHQMPPLELQLSARRLEAAADALGCDFTGVEAVAARSGFGMHLAQVGGNACNRRRVRAKADQLGVASIPGGFSPEHRLRQEPFAPQRNQPAGVQIFRMEAPEPQPDPIMAAVRTGTEKSTDLGTATQDRRAAGALR